MTLWQRISYWFATHTRMLFFWGVVLFYVVLGFLLLGCANTPVQRSTETPAYSMREGQAVTIQFQPAEKIAEFARRHIDAAYRVDAVAFPNGENCTVWMRPGWVDLYLLNHELAHCAGLRHDRNGRWEN